MIYRVRIAASALVMATCLPVWSQSGTAPTPTPQAERLYMRSLAATCAHCHGTDGKAVQGEAMIRLAGQSRDYLLTQLMAFRTGDRKATIMHQITRGYSEEQLERLAVYFAAIK